MSEPYTEQAASRKLKWYGSRLVSMSVEEIAHRCMEQLKRWISRFHVPDMRIWLERSDGRMPGLPFVGEAVERVKVSPEAVALIESYAKRVAAGRVSLLGQTWTLSEGAPSWQLDPITGNHWPSNVYCFAIPYRHSHKWGDVKYVWELSRLQYLQPVAAYATLVGNDAYAALCWRHIESWIDDNPPFQGVQWASGIELALRVVSIIVVVSLLGEKDLSSELKAKVLWTLACHGFWLERYPSRFSSANNHLVAEAGALFLLGSLMSPMPQAQKWSESGRRTLEQEVQNQFHDDGVGAEQSPSYQSFSLEWFLLCGYFARSEGQDFSPEYYEQLESAGEFIHALMDESGHVPRIGDDDEGHVIYDGAEPGQYMGSILGCLALVAQRPDLAPAALRYDLRQSLYGDPIQGPKPHEGVRHFPKGGYTVAREDNEGKELLWVLDHGPLGFLSIAAHGHADTLAVWLHIAGRPILVDGGTFAYYARPEWRRYFRSTRGHNALSIGGADSSQTAGAFNWAHKANAMVREFRSDLDTWVIEAEHDGFLSRHGVLHRRRLEKESHGVYVLTDMLVGERSPQDVEIGFTAAPDLSVVNTGDSWHVRDAHRGLLSIRHEGQFEAEVHSGIEAPLGGWHSPRYGSRIPASRLVFRGEMRTNVAAVFTLTIL